MENGALMQGGPYGPVQPILEVQGVAPLHYVRKQVSEERGIFSEECFEVQGCLRGNEFVQPDLPGRHGSPVLGGHMSMVGVRTSIAHSFEDHPSSLEKIRRQ